MDAHIGTSGFSYKEWKGVFYPPELSPGEYLAYYSREFTTTEINNTFYRIPSEKTTGQWASQVPGEFRFSLKLSQRITHRKRLRDVEEEMDWFRRGVAPLAGRLGCILVQLPPWLRQDLATLEEFLVKYAGKPLPLAFEFRHESWYEVATFALLRQHQSALCIAESEESENCLEVTAPFIYLRLRKPVYSEEELGRWADWIRKREEASLVYFKHEEAAPGYARKLQQLLQKTDS